MVLYGLKHERVKFFSQNSLWNFQKRYLQLSCLKFLLTHYIPLGHGIRVSALFLFHRSIGTGWFVHCRHRVLSLLQNGVSRWGRCSCPSTCTGWKVIFMEKSIFFLVELELVNWRKNKPYLRKKHSRAENKEDEEGHAHRCCRVWAARRFVQNRCMRLLSQTLKSQTGIGYQEFPMRMQRAINVWKTGDPQNIQYGNAIEQKETFVVTDTSGAYYILSADIKYTAPISGAV